MGFARRVVRKSVRKATPRSVQRATHPVRTLKSAATPRPVRQVSRAVYTVTNPLGAAENKFIGAVLGGNGSRRGSGGRPSMRGVSVAADQGVSVSDLRAVESASAVRAAEAVAVQDRSAQLMAVQRERFADARRLVIPDPKHVDPGPEWTREWARRKGDVRFWDRACRKQLRLEVNEHARAHAAEVFVEAQAEQRAQQGRADAWWEALNQGDPAVLTAALKAAFADNSAPVAVIEASGSNAVLMVLLPRPDELPKKRGNLVPSGQISNKPWMNTKFNDAYAELVGAHLLATARETWACAPSLTTLRIVGARKRVGIGAEILFDVDTERAQGLWSTDNLGETILQHSEWGLNRTGLTNEVRPWPGDQLRRDAPGLCRGQLNTGERLFET